ncbi:MAG TPA: ABC transporter permease [Polyangiaceae bacterium]|nr:ABC transporter permease [Polyangiaceae bacterium]
MIRITLVMALREIRRNTLRSFLTMLGIVIGVGAVIALVTIGQGATARVTADIAKLGDNLLIVTPGGDRRSGAYTPAPSFEQEDVLAIEREVASIQAVAPTAARQALVVWGNRNLRTSVTGTTNAYLDVRASSIATGRVFTDTEANSGRPLCIIGATVRQALFGSADPLGAAIRLDKVSCEVIGVLAAKGQSSMGQDQDDIVLTPLRTVQRRLAGNKDVNAIYVSATSASSTGRVKAQIEQLMRERRRVAAGNEDNFSVRDMQEIAQAVTSATGTMTALLGAIAAVSLLVGGIGIMNIMLVNVTERTREIGIRLAIGARASEVLLQFLVEAIVLSMIGGVIGIIVGLLGSYWATSALQVPFVVVPDILVVAFLFSAVVGIAFGYLPAHKAARLNPIEALRHE